MKVNEKDITDPETFAHFIDCPKCGWSFDPEFFQDHKCIDMNKPGYTENILPTNEKGEV